MLDQVELAFSLISHSSLDDLAQAGSEWPVPATEDGGRLPARHPENPGSATYLQRPAARGNPSAPPGDQRRCRPWGSGDEDVCSQAVVQVAICARVLTPSLFMMCCTWVSAVRDEMTSSLAISFFTRAVSATRSGSP